MAIRRLEQPKGTPNQVNVPFQGGGLLGGNPNVGPTNFNPRQAGAGLLAGPGGMGEFDIQNAPPGYTIDDIIRDVIDAGGTIEDAKAVAAQVLPQEGAEFTEQDWQNNWAKEYRDRMYGGENPPAVDEVTTSDGSYFQDIPQDVEQRYPLEGGGGSDTLLGASPDYFRQQAEAGKDITPSLPFDSPQVMQMAEGVSPVDIPGSAKGGTSVPTGRFSKEGAGIAGKLVDDLKKDFGLTDYQAQGAVANLAHESRGFKTMQEVSPTVKGSRGGYGYAQWTGPRRKEFEAFAKNSGLDIDSYEANYGFLKHELQTTEKGSLRALKRTTNLREATKTFEDKFERAGVVNMNSRNKWADVLSTSVPGTPQAQTTIPSSRPGLFDAPQVDYSSLPQSVEEAHQNMDDRISQMDVNNPDPRGDQIVATPGESVYHPDGVNGTQQKLEEAFDPFTPRPVKTQSIKIGPDGNFVMPSDTDTTKTRRVVPGKPSLADSVRDRANSRIEEGFDTDKFGPPGGVDGTYRDPSLYNPTTAARGFSSTLPKGIWDDVLNNRPTPKFRGLAQPSDVTRDLKDYYGTDRKDLYGGSRDSSASSRVSVPSETNNFLSADDLQRYQEFLTPSTTPAQQYNPSADSGFGASVPEQYKNDIALELSQAGVDPNASYREPTPAPAPAPQVWGGDTDPRTNESWSPDPINNYDTGRDWDAPTYRNDTMAGPGGTYSYGSTPRYEDYSYTPNITKTVTNPEWTKWSNAQSNANQSEYEKASGILDLEDWGPIEPQKTIEVTTKGEPEKRQRRTTRTSRLPRNYNKYTQGIIDQGMKQPLAGQRKGLFDGVKPDLPKTALGLLAGGIPGAAVGSGVLPQIAKNLTGNYQGMHTGGSVPALSRGVQLGGAYDVYGDRSGRNTWAVANSGAVVSRSNNGWTSVTSNVNGKGPVTTIQNDSNLATNRDPRTMTPIWGGKGDGILGNGDTEGEQGGGCVVATHAVNSGAFSPKTKREAVVWCMEKLHGKWWGEAIRRGYRHLGNSKIEQGKAHEHYKEFKDYINFATGKERTVKGAVHFLARSTQFLLIGLVKRKA